MRSAIRVRNDFVVLKSEQNLCRNSITDKYSGERRQRETLVRLANPGKFDDFKTNQIEHFESCTECKYFAE